MKRYFSITLNGKDLPSKIQYEFFAKYTRFFGQLTSEFQQDKVYISYDDMDPISSRVISRLHNYFLPGFCIEECKNHCFYKNSLAEIIHPIEKNIDITLFPYISMFLPVIMGHRKYESWYYSNFINVMCINEKGFYNYTDDRNFFRRILTENAVQYIRALSFSKKTFMDSLFDDYYIYVWIDSCYTGDWSGSKDLHEAHPILIYGMNKDRNIYYCYRFSPDFGVFQCEYDIDMVHLSMESARIEIGDHVDDTHVCIFKLKDIEAENLFDKYRFLQELENYIFSTGDRISEYCRAEINISADTNICFGLDVTRNVLELLKGNAQNENFDYRLIHLITEHKQLLLRRFEYVSDLFSISNHKLNDLINDYRQITKQYQNVKNCFTKNSLKESQNVSFYKPPKSEKAVLKMVNNYEQLIQKEQIVLKEIYDILHRYLLIGDYRDGGSNYYYLARREFCKDNDGCYEYLYWNEPIAAKKIFIINMYNKDNSYCQGKMVVNDGVECIEYDPCNSKNGETFVSFNSLQDIKWIKFYPQKYFINENNNLLIGFKILQHNLLEDAEAIIPSSVIQVQGLDCSAKNMIKEDPQFWCPAEEDQERFVIFKFNTPISFNCCVIGQDPAALRIMTYKVECFDGIWKQALFSEEPIGREPVRTLLNQFSNVQMIKLSIIRTKPSLNGYDLPNVTSFAVYNRVETF